MFVHVMPENATYKHVKWDSNNSDIAMVTTEGRIMAFTVGQVKITATTQDGSDISASCEVTVVLKGDADGNGKLEIADLLCVIDYIVNGVECPAMDLANIDGEGSVDLNDLASIVEMLVK